MHDKDGSGSIDMDECMEVLFRRFGRDSLEKKVNEFMSHDMVRVAQHAARSATTATGKLRSHLTRLDST